MTTPPARPDLEPTGSELRLLTALAAVVEERRLSAVPSGAPRTSRTARRRRRAAAVSVLGGAAVAVATLVTPGAQAFAVSTLPDGRVQVRLGERFTDARALQDRLAEAGINVRVTEHPGLPCQVGRVVGAIAVLQPVPLTFPTRLLLPDPDPNFVVTEDGFVMRPGTIDGRALSLAVEPRPGEVGGYMPGVPGCPDPAPGPGPAASS